MDAAERGERARVGRKCIREIERSVYGGHCSDECFPELFECAKLDARPLFTGWVGVVFATADVECVYWQGRGPGGFR